MSDVLIGQLGLLAALVLLISGVPIGVTLGVVGIIGLAILISPEAALIRSGVVAFETVTRYELGTLPLFLFMAHVLFAAGASQRLFDAAAKFVGHKRGGLALAAIGGCAGFGSVSGSSLGTVATMSLVALPEMRRHNYDPGLATGALAAGGTLGSMIPPSGALIVYGIIAEQSIGRLFTAAIIPGLTQALFYMIAIALLCAWKPSLGPPLPRAPWRERFASLVAIADLMLLVGVVLVGLVVGWFTPTEAASIGAVGALVLVGARGKLTWKVITDALEETLRTSGMIYAVIIGALIFGTFINASGFAELVSQLMTGLNAGPFWTVIVMAIILLILGTFLDGMGVMLLATPIFLPIIEQMGLSPIWFGIIVVRAMEIGFVHPPVGLNVYVIHGMARDIPLMTIFIGVIPFLITDLIHLGVLIAWPDLTMALVHWTGQ